jgi:hypothetical protein
MRWRVTAIIQVVEMAWMQVVHLFFTMNRSCLADCHMDWSQSTSTEAPPAYADSVDRFFRFRLTMMLLI